MFPRRGINVKREYGEYDYREFIVTDENDIQVRIYLFK